MALSGAISALRHAMGGKVNYQSEGERTQKAEERQRQQFEDRLRQQLEDWKRAVGFAASCVLPGETQAEFDELLEDLRIEFEPEGPAQDDAVQTMARAIFRKRHLDIFQRAADARMRWGHYFEYPNDQGGVYKILLKNLQKAMKAAEPIVSDNPVDTKRSIDKAQHNNKGDNDSKAAGAAIDQKPQGEGSTGVQNALKPEFSGIHSDLGASFKLLHAAQDFETAVREDIGSPPSESIFVATHISNQIELAKRGDLITPSCFQAELDMIEELDRVIERCQSRLMKMKAAKLRHTTKYKDPLVPEWRRRRHT